MEKIIKLEDFNNKSLDNIIELYRYGHVLEGTQSTIKAVTQQQIQQLQLPSYSTSIITILAGALVGLVVTSILKRK
jgi:hypothetical protein